MAKEINYSMIIPHKNIPDLLQRCLASIPRREDVQIIVVDDNSDTDKVDFERFPGLDDPFIEVIFTKDGNGAGYARNIGLTKAAGKWLLFADADDYFSDGFLQCLDKYRDSDCDLIYFGTYGIDSDTKQEIINSKEYKILLEKAIQNKKYDAFKYRSYTPWGKIIKRSLVKENNLEFDKTCVLEDVMFSVKTAYYAKSVNFDEYRIYTHELRYNSITFIRTPESDFDRFCVILRVNAFLKSIQKEKYKVNIVIFLLHLINIHDMSYFHRGMEMIKEKKINLLMECTRFCLSIPFRLARKAKAKYYKFRGKLKIQSYPLKE